MGKTRKTGLVCTIEAVPKEHQVAIIWTRNAEGQQVGFVYDEDNMLRNEIAARVAEFCNERGFAIGTQLENEWVAKAKIEEVSQDTFFNWFGGYPESPELFFDSWGKSDDYRKAYGVPNDYEGANTAEYRKRSQRCGLVAGALSAAVFVAVAVVFVAVAALISGGQPLTMAIYTLLSVVLIGFGVIFALAQMQNLARYFYRRQMRKN